LSCSSRAEAKVRAASCNHSQSMPHNDPIGPRRSCCSLMRRRRSLPRDPASSRSDIADSCTSGGAMLSPRAKPRGLAFVARLCAAAETKDGEFPTFKIYVTVTYRPRAANATHNSLGLSHLVGRSHSLVPARSFRCPPIPT
jgi:hypothetical protein